MKTMFALATALLPVGLLAHPGHGLGTLGHGLDHALWNFAGVVVLSAVVLVLARWRRKDK